MATTTDAAEQLLKLFAAKVKERRLLLGLTQSQIAERLGVSQSRYQRIEAGRYPPGLDVISRVAEALGCRASELLD